jgi:hypothetical protein
LSGIVISFGLVVNRREKTGFRRYPVARETGFAWVGQGVCVRAAGRYSCADLL